jgi:hypothetical protein
MLNNIEDIKLFIEWCKEKKVKVFKSDNVQFELSELSFVEDTVGYADKIQTPVQEAKFEEEQQQEEDDELLFWSSNPQD